MGKLAFVFSGQGAQHAGMGLELYQTQRSSARIFELCDNIRPGTSAQCFDGPEDALTLTSNTQPCLFAVELAAAAALTQAGIRPDVTAGFSLGELSALTFSGAVPFEEGFRLVCKRGALMQADSERFDSGMAAVLKLDADTVEALCARYAHVYPVNYNCPGQISVAGLKQELEAFLADVKEAGGRAVPLKVAGGFHCPFMQNAAESFGRLLKSVLFRVPRLTLYSDYTGLPYAGDFAELLSRQICSPVRWQSIIEHMLEDGVDTFVEIGPGKTLCGLISRISAGARVFNVEDSTSLNAALAGLQSGDEAVTASRTVLVGRR